MENKKGKASSTSNSTSHSSSGILGPDGRVLEGGGEDVDRLKKREGSEQRFDEQTDQFEIVGKDEGEKRVLSTMQIVPVNQRGQTLTREQVLQIAMKHFEIHFARIGWTPSHDYGPQDVVINQREDGNWHAVAWLAKARASAKEWDDFPKVGVNDVGQAGM